MYLDPFKDFNFFGTGVKTIFEFGGAKILPVKLETCLFLLNKMVSVDVGDPICCGL